MKVEERPDFIDESGLEDDIPNYDDPQFIDDDNDPLLTDDLDESTPNFEEDKEPGRLELEPGEESDFINLDEPDFE